MKALFSFLRSKAVSSVERVRTSLFVVPMVFVLAAIALAQLTLAIDDANRRGTIGLPFTSSTVDSAREVLTTVAAATIGFAGVAFSVSLLVVQMASSQYSPRVVSGLLSNPFSKRVMGTVVGTFTYCLVVLREVRSAPDNGDEAVVATLSVTLGVVLGIVSILATIAFINNSAHSMDVSELMQGITDDSVEVVRSEWSEPDRYPIDHGPAPDPPDDAHRVRFTSSGWIQRIDYDALMKALPPASTLHLEVATGRYAVAGATLGELDPEPDEDDDLERLESELRSAVHTGAARTSRQDVAYGIRQLEDVALKALSTGVNDPTTAQDALFHICVILRELLERRPPDAVTIGTHDRRIVRHHEHDHRELVAFSFEQFRRAATDDPAVCVYLLEAIKVLCESLVDVTDDARAALVEQARLVVAGCESGNSIDADIDLVREAFDKRFAS